MKAIQLQTDYLANPIGIDHQQPRLFWKLEGGIEQTAYQIQVFDFDGKMSWDSGQVLSSKMTGIPFEAKIHSRASYKWQVRVWDEKGIIGPWSELATLEFGLLKPSDWKAKWICGASSVNPKDRYPVDLFRKEFVVEKKVKKARLYATACGIYEARINGQRVGDFVLAPGHTDYTKRIQYQTYDVTNLLGANNQVEIELADGWYRGSCGAFGLKNQYGKETKVLAQLEIEFTDGSQQVIVTDSSWDWSNDGPIRFADNKDGEQVDARMHASYHQNARETNYSIIPVASNNVAIKEHEVFHPKLIKKEQRNFLFDLGQNIAGYVAFEIVAKEGQEIYIRCGELLDSSGHLTLDNIQCKKKEMPTPLQEIHYICKEGVNYYKTKFAIFGFQYIEVQTELDLRAENIRAIAVYSDLEFTSHFHSSNELLNKFVENTRWSWKNNSADVPTDCPTRERHGWTGDSQIFTETANYLVNFYPFAHKHLKDIYDWQKPDGKLPQIAPAGGVDSYMNPLNGSVGWADAGILIPYRIWKFYQDDSLIREFYDGMVRYARFMANRCHKWTPLAHRIKLKGEARKYLVNYGQSYGEWAEPEEVCPNHWSNMIMPHPEVSTAYTAWMMRLMAEIAIHLGEAEDAHYFSTYADKVKTSYQALVKLSKYSLDTDRQAQLVRPLYLDLLTEEQKKFAQKRLIQALENYNWRVGTGFLSTPFILYVLSEFDIESAYRLLENEEIPGWLAMPKLGATTIWEGWEGSQAPGGIASLNHYSKGAVVEWLFKVMCGIRIKGDREFIIEPKPGGHFTFAQAEIDTIFGQVRSEWKKEGDVYRFQVKIPANCKAQIVLPNKERIFVASGQYEFVV